MKAFRNHYYLIEKHRTTMNYMDPNLDPDTKKLVEDAFINLSQAQRNRPESAMLKIGRASAGVWSWLIEHIGDLTHRMTENPAWFQGGWGNVKEKSRQSL